ncbi:MAG TPA: hypothetical protein VE251_14125 [Xanthobacteraceae bacterium]|nr:hypothetical protein [Xanthobacteraceae bacterium]
MTASGAILVHRGESGIQLLIAADPDGVDRRSGGCSAKLDLFEEGFDKGIGCIGETGDAARRRQHVADELDAFAGEFRADARNSGDVAARPRKAGDESRGDRISRVRHDDGDFVRGLLCRLSGGREPRDDDVDLETDQLGGQFGKPAELSLRRSKFVSNVLPFDIPEIAQPLPEFPPKLFRIGIADDQGAHDSNLRRLLCAREERPKKRRHRRAAEQRDELAASERTERFGPAAFHSITSSAPNGADDP